jgi:hypothetical protein
MRWLFIDYHRYHTSRTSINVIDRSFRPQFLPSPAEVLLAAISLETPWAATFEHQRQQRLPAAPCREPERPWRPSSRGASAGEALPQKLLTMAATHC